MKLYSYVVDHDHGLSPNPSGGFCTLVHCKFNKSGKRRNIVEMANIGDWVLGTGGQSQDSAGNGKIIYLMRIDEKPSFQDFLEDTRFAGRADRCDLGEGNAFALISTHYYYFGRNALRIDDLPENIRTPQLEKKKQNYLCHFSEDQINLLVSWFENNVTLGVSGEPCSPQASYVMHSDLQAACSSSCSCAKNPAHLLPDCNTKRC